MYVEVQGRGKKRHNSIQHPQNTIPSPKSFFFFWGGGRLKLVQSRVPKTVLGKRALESYDTLDPWQDQGTKN